MRLLNTKTFRMKEFFDDGEGTSIPEYAILSHRWGDDEVTYQQFLALTGQSAIFESSGPLPSNFPLQSRAHLPGVGKLLNACRVASSRSLEWIWIDTCCIDKSSSAELSEAINSMWNWYAESKECYAFLRDVQNGSTLAQEDYRPLRESEWFQRGWTLQELLAPDSVLFFDIKWQMFGAKTDVELSKVIAAITKIPDGAVCKQVSIQRYSIATRLSWAAYRRTSRIEDRAYSLLGLCGINIPLLYGEGKRAFKRLQEEIIRSADDESIFAHYGSSLWGALARRPEDFVREDGLPIYTNINTQRFLRGTALGSAAFAITNKGIEMRAVLVELPAINNECEVMVLNCFVQQLAHSPANRSLGDEVIDSYTTAPLPILLPVKIVRGAPQDLHPSCIILPFLSSYQARLERARKTLEGWMGTETKDPFMYEVVYLVNDSFDSW